MLEKRVLRTKERLAGHKSFLPQEVVWRNIWTWGSLKKALFQTMISTKKDAIDLSFK
jgi:hypothetical protein